MHIYYSYIQMLIFIKEHICIYNFFKVYLNRIMCNLGIKIFCLIIAIMANVIRDSVCFRSFL